MINNKDIEEIMRIFSPRKSPDFSKLFSNDISKPEYVILLTCRHINNMGKQAYVSDLVREFAITPQAISKHLRSCEKKGYIERNADKEDRRNVIITITDEGNKVLDESHTRAKLLKEHMVSKIGETEFREMAEQINRFRILLCDSIEEMSKEAKEAARD